MEKRWRKWRKSWRKWYLDEHALLLGSLGQQNVLFQLLDAGNRMRSVRDIPGNHIVEVILYRK